MLLITNSGLQKSSACRIPADLLHCACFSYFLLSLGVCQDGCSARLLMWGYWF